jgi:hypothetical protein
MKFKDYCNDASAHMREMWDLVSQMDLLTQRIAPVGLGQTEMPLLLAQIEAVAMKFEVRRQKLDLAMNQIVTEEPGMANGLGAQLIDLDCRFSNLVGRMKDKHLQYEGEWRVEAGAQLS